MEPVLVRVSPKVRTRILQLIAAGCSIKVCALIVGCDEHVVRRWLYRGEEDAAPDSFTPEPRRPVLTSVEAQRAQQARSLLMSGASIPDTARAMAVPESRVISWLVSDESHRLPMR